MFKEIVRDDPGNLCFGCSPHNERGLRLRFVQTGAAEVEAEYTAPEAYCGAKGVLHGGIQATLLDEVMGAAARVSEADKKLNIATADFHIRYRRPAPVGVALKIRGRLVRADGRDFFLEGAILGSDGAELTRAEARWRRIIPSRR